MRIVLITSGTVAILLLLAVWAYLLFFGTPDNVKEITADLGFDNQPTEFTPIEIDQGESTITLSSQVIAQLTTRAVAGFGIEQNNEGDIPVIRYVERGTGHIYEINLNTSQERRVSGSTIGQTVEAYFNDTLDKVVIVSESGDTTHSSLYSLNEEGAAKLEDLPTRSSGFSFNSVDNLNYVSVSNVGSTAYQYNPESGQTSTLWSTPLRDINVYWTDNDALVINRPAPRLKSGVYVANGSSFYQLISPKYDLAVTIGANGRQLLYSFFNPTESKREAYVLNRDTSENILSDLSGVPEKCTYLTLDEFWCASSVQIESGRESITAWYRGEFTSSDTFWKQITGEASAEHVAFLSEIAGFDVDVTDIQASNDGRWLFFRNKLNDALWMYRVSEPPPDLETLQTEEETTDASVEQTPEQ